MPAIVTHRARAFKRNGVGSRALPHVRATRTAAAGGTAPSPFPVVDRLLGGLDAPGEPHLREPHPLANPAVASRHVACRFAVVLPPLLVLDEATGQLDANTERRMLATAGYGPERARVE